MRFIILIIILSVNVQSAELIRVNIAADPWCPFNCEAKSNRQGFMIDIAREALVSQGYELNYTNLPWTRAKLSVVNGEIDGVVGMAFTATSKDKYHFPNHALGRSQICFFTEQKSTWVYNSIDDLSSQTVGWINDYGYASSPNLNQWINANKHSNKVFTVSGADTIYQRLFKLLTMNRITTFADDKNVILNYVQQFGLNNDIKEVGCLPKYDEVFIAFSLKTNRGQVLASALDAGIEHLKQQGTLESLLTPYGLTLETWMK